MDAVKSFNNELSGLYEFKPPISKAKMTSITRGAIKAIKFYKHVVQSVEKFILKCKPEYKIPGLYVIDSIVRQSRHQFGADRDVFAPRFAKNIQQTFLNLFKCPAEDKSKVIRVLNLWQKNQVFQADVIQPLFDLADPNHPLYREQSTTAQSNGLSTSNSSGNIVRGSPALQKSPTKASSQVQHAPEHIPGTNMPNPLHADPNTLAQLQQLHKLLQRQNESGIKPDGGQPVRFDRKLLDFDYDDDEDEDHVNPSPKPPANNSNTNNTSAMETVGSLLSNPEVLRQLQTLQQTISQTQHTELDLEKLRKLQEMKQQEEEFDKHLAQTVPNLPFASECDLKPPTSNASPGVMQNYYHSGVQDMSIPPPGYKQTLPSYEMSSQQDEITLDSEIHYVDGNDGGDLEVINLDHVDSISQSPHEERYATNRRRRSRSRDRSRDRGRDRDRRSRRSRSRSRSRDRRRRSRSREKEREREREKEKEKEKERKKRGLPPIKKENLSICSTTLWVGHLSKLVHQEELSGTFGEFGDVVSIDLIPPRGCAFIVMHRRQDAARCLQKLKNHKMQSKAITLAWAPGKGVKGKDLKDYWEIDLGVSYIPWSKLKPDINLEMLEDGGMIDEDTMPDWLKAKIAQDNQKDLLSSQPAPLSEVTITTSTAIIPTPPATTIDTSQPPPIPGGGLLQPPALPLSIVSPFQINNRLLGMNLPPGMMPNIPIGVPPPNLPPAMMANQLMGISSPFAQAPPGMLPQIPLPTPEKAPTSISENLSTESVLNLPFNITIPQPPMSIPPPHEDHNMDVEMEDAEKLEKPPPLSDQLLASLGQQNKIETNFNAAVSRLHAVTDFRNDSLNKHERQDDMGFFRGHDINRNRDQDNKEKRNNFDRGHDDRDKRDNRRERVNRWNNRDHDLNENHDDRKDRTEKSLNDRLREIAHQSSFHGRDKSRRNIDEQEMFSNNNNADNPLLERPWFSSNRLEGEGDRNDRFRQGGGSDFNQHMRKASNDWREKPNFDLKNHSKFEPPLLNRDDNGPRPFFNRDNGPSRIIYSHDDDGSVNEGGRRPLINQDSFREDDRFIRRDRADDFDRGPPMFGQGPSPGRGMGPGPGHAMGPPGPGHGPGQGHVIGPGPGQEHMIGSGPGQGHGPGPGHNMAPLMRSIMGPGPGMGGPRGGGPRHDFWGPPRPMRGSGGDGFNIRGRPPGPNKFQFRGQHMRGPRPLGPHWKEGGGMRQNFQPRFEGPPDYFRGPPGQQNNIPGLFDESPHHQRHRRRDDRRNFRQELEDNAEHSRDNKRDRQSRWNNSPRVEEQNNQGEIKEILIEKICTNPDTARVSERRSSVQKKSEPNTEGDGNSTPLHDEPQESFDKKEKSQDTIESKDENEATTDVQN